MENINEVPHNTVLIRLPIRVSYRAIETYLRENFIGERIKANNDDGTTTSYAEILDISIDESLEEKYDIVVDLKFKLLTSLYKNKEGRILLHVLTNFDQTQQHIDITDFKLIGNTSSWLLNNALEAMANTFVHKKLKNQMNYNFTPIIENQVSQINQKIENDLEVREGVHISGKLDQFKISAIIARSSYLLININLEGNTLVEIEKIVKP